MVPSWFCLSHVLPCPWHTGGRVDKSKRARDGHSWKQQDGNAKIPVKCEWSVWILGAFVRITSLRVSWVVYHMPSQFEHTTWRQMLPKTWVVAFVAVSCCLKLFLLSFVQLNRMKWTWMAETMLKLQGNHAPFPTFYRDGATGQKRLMTLSPRSWAWNRNVSVLSFSKKWGFENLQQKRSTEKKSEKKSTADFPFWGVQRLRRLLLHGCWRRQLLHFDFVADGLNLQVGKCILFKKVEPETSIIRNHRILSTWKEDKENWQANLTILQRLWQLPGDQGFLACGLFLTVPDFMPQFWPTYDRTTIRLIRYILVTYLLTASQWPYGFI